jgi:hypothetical protein
MWQDIILPALKFIGFALLLGVGTAFGGWLDYKASEERKAECVQSGGKVIVNRRDLIIGCVLNGGNNATSVD